EKVFAELGLTVEKLTLADAPAPEYVGAMKMTAINADSPTQNLAVGDIVVSMQSTGRRVTLNLVRGAERIPVAVDLPLAPAEAAQRTEQTTRKLYERGQGSFANLNEAQRALEAARLRVEKANTLLELYRKADPKRTDGPAGGPESGPAPAR